MAWHDFVDFWSDTMPAMPWSLPSFGSLLTSSSQIALGTRLAFDSNARSCPNAQISCQNTSVVADLCCFNAPGGQMLQTQFWDTNPPTGPSDSWTIHGLWPDLCDGTYEANCDDTRDYSNITQILHAFNATSLLDTMSTYWKDYQGRDASLWMHEWAKHGTCVSTLSPSCYPDYQPQEEVVDYFQAAVSLYETLPSYQWLSDAGIVPTTSQTYTKAEILAALQAHHDKPVTLGCHRGALDEIWYHFDVKGSVQTGIFIPTDPDGSKDTCSSTGIKYLPKASSSPTATQTTAVPRPTATGPPFTGRGFLNVNTGGMHKGCIIGAGTWYTTGSCATFTVSDAGDGFTLASRKGSCAIHSGALTCGPTVSDADVFASDGASLSFGGNTTFFADKVPRGSTQGTVYVAGEGHSTDLTISWHGI